MVETNPILLHWRIGQMPSVYYRCRFYIPEWVFRLHGKTCYNTVNWSLLHNASTSIAYVNGRITCRSSRDRKNRWSSFYDFFFFIVLSKVIYFMVCWTSLILKKILEKTLREKCPNTKLFLVRILPHLDTFTQWIVLFSGTKVVERRVSKKVCF